MAGENIVGNAFVAIRPDTSKFASELTNLLPTTGGPLGKLIHDLGPGGLLAVALAGTGAVMVDMASKFQVSQASLQANMGITAQQAAAIGSAFLATGGQTTFSAQEMLTAFDPVARQLGALNGGALNAFQSLGFMNSAMALAEATGQPLNDVTGALVKTMIAYKLPLSDAAGATDILTNSSILLNQPVTDIALAVDKLGGSLGTAAPSLADASALMVDLFNTGVPARKAVSEAAGAIQSLELPSQQGAKAIHDLGLKVLDSHGKFVGMDSIIKQLNPKYATMTQNQQEATSAFLFGKPAAAAMTDVIGKGVKPFTDLAGAVRKVGSAQADAKTKTDTLKGTWDKFKGGVADLGVNFGKVLTPVLQLAANDALPAINSAMNWLVQHPELVKNIMIPLVAAFSTWAAIATAGKLLSMVTGLATSMGIMAGGAAATELALAPWLALGALGFVGVIEFLNLVNPIGQRPHIPGVNPTTGAYQPKGGAPVVPGKTYFNAPGHAAGGDVAPFGLSWVGETGAELIQAGAQGAHVYSNSQSRSMSGPSIHQTLQFYGVEDTRAIEAAIARNNRSLILHLAAR